MTDEDIIKRKLLIDGDGTGDDRRLNVISKTLKKWANTIDETPIESHSTHDKLLAQLTLCEYSVKRSQLLSKTATRQLNDYKKIQQVLEQQIGDVKKSIEQSKDNLVQAKIWKQNHVMYDLLAQNIAQQPARTETNTRLNSLQDELKKLHQEKESLEHKLEERRKQFHVLVASASKLQVMLDEVDESSNTEPEPMSD